jgi:hypothetical protein
MAANKDGLVLLKHRQTGRADKMDPENLHSLRQCVQLHVPVPEMNLAERRNNSK